MTLSPAQLDEQREADMAKACVIMTNASRASLPTGRAVSLIADALAEARAPLQSELAAKQAVIDKVVAVTDEWDEWSGTDQDPRSTLARFVVADLRTALAGQEQT